MPDRTVAYRDGYEAGREALARSEDTDDDDVRWWRGYLDAIDGKDGK